MKESSIKNIQKSHSPRTRACTRIACHARARAAVQVARLLSQRRRYVALYLARAAHTESPEDYQVRAHCASVCQPLRAAFHML
jgi:hypothetical protein